MTALEPGARVELVAMGDDPDPIPPGTRGTVTSHRNVGTDFEQIGVEWDNGRRLMVCPPAGDRVQVLEHLARADAGR